ncbi:hypothetical protein [Mesorhizobium sp. M1322]|uniref:hypothetical protein n=1 Tax=Mesorhizobium sp. M1322 TaxID=2957081 RepID=UPI00333CA97D
MIGTGPTVRDPIKATTSAADARTPLSIATGPAATVYIPMMPSLTSVQKYSPTSTFRPKTAAELAPANPADAAKLKFGATV